MWVTFSARRGADRDFGSSAAHQSKDIPVKHLFKVAAIAFAVAGSSVATVGAITPASAADTVVVFDPGAVRYGYNDGYWDHAHAWHAGGQPAHMQA